MGSDFGMPAFSTMKVFVREMCAFTILSCIKHPLRSTQNFLVILEELLITLSKEKLLFRQNFVIYLQVRESNFRRACTQHGLRIACQ